MLERAMERADDVMTEGRDRVLDLRDTIEFLPKLEPIDRHADRAT